MQQTTLLTTNSNIMPTILNNNLKKNNKTNLTYHQQQLQLIDKGTKEWVASTYKNCNDDHCQQFSKSPKNFDGEKNPNYKYAKYNNNVNEEDEEDDGNNLRNCGANTTERVPVASSEHVAEIVGRQGSKIKALRAKTNTYIKTPVRGEEPIFVVTGRPDDVTAAKLEILSVAEHFDQVVALNKARPLPFPDSENDPEAANHVTVKVRVPYRVVGLLVGPKGATIKRIQLDTQTYIVTPSRDKEPVFEITGTPENVAKAKTEIEGYIALRTGLAELSPQQQQLQIQLQQQLQLQLQQQLLLATSSQVWRNGFNPLFCMDLLSLSNNQQWLKSSEKASLLQYLQTLISTNSEKKDDVDWAMYDSSFKNNTNNDNIDFGTLISNMQIALNNLNNNTDNNFSKSHLQNNKNIYYCVDPSANTFNFENLYNNNKANNIFSDASQKKSNETRKMNLSSCCQTPVPFLNEDFLSFSTINYNNNNNVNTTNNNLQTNANNINSNLFNNSNNNQNTYKGYNGLKNGNFSFGENENNQNFNGYFPFNNNDLNAVEKNKLESIFQQKNRLTNISNSAVKENKNDTQDLENNYDFLLQQNLLNLTLQNNNPNFNNSENLLNSINNNLSSNNNYDTLLPNGLYSNLNNNKSVNHVSYEDASNNHENEEIHSIQTKNFISNQLFNSNSFKINKHLINCINNDNNENIEYNHSFSGSNNVEKKVLPLNYGNFSEKNYDFSNVSFTGPKSSNNSLKMSDDYSKHPATGNQNDNFNKTHNTGAFAASQDQEDFTSKQQNKNSDKNIQSINGSINNAKNKNNQVLKGTNGNLKLQKSQSNSDTVVSSSDSSSNSLTSSTPSPPVL